MTRALLIVGLFSFGCSEPEKPAPAAPAPSPTPVDPWVEAQGLIETYCSRCHNGAPFLETGEAFKRSKSRGRLERREMPPPSSNEGRDMDQATRDRLVGFLAKP